MKLTCIRHTKVDVPNGICYGQTDVKLAATYNEEKKMVARALDGLSFDMVFSSPLSRCRLLAEDLFASQAIKYDDRLREFNFGCWEGKAWVDIYVSAAGRKWMDDYLVLPCDGGESYPQMQARVATFLHDLLKYECGNVAIVTHSGVIRLIKSTLEKTPIDEVMTSFHPDFGELHIFNYHAVSKPTRTG